MIINISTTFKTILTMLFANMNLFFYIPTAKLLCYSWAKFQLYIIYIIFISFSPMYWYSWYAIFLATFDHFILYHTMLYVYITIYFIKHLYDHFEVKHVQILLSVVIVSWINRSRTPALAAVVWWGTSLVSDWDSLHFLSVAQAVKHCHC